MVSCSHSYSKVTTLITVLVELTQSVSADSRIVTTAHFAWEKHFLSGGQNLKSTAKFGKVCNHFFKMHVFVNSIKFDMGDTFMQKTFF